MFSYHPSHFKHVPQTGQYFCMLNTSTPQDGHFSIVMLTASLSGCLSVIVSLHDVVAGDVVGVRLVGLPTASLHVLLSIDEEAVFTTEEAGHRLTSVDGPRILQNGQIVCPGIAG